MASNGNKTVLMVVAIAIGLAGVAAVAVVALSGMLFLRTDAEELPQPEAVSVEVPAEPGASAPPVFVEPEEDDDTLGLIDDEPEPDRPIPELGLEEFKAMSSAEIVAAMSFMRLHKATQWDGRVDLPRTLELVAPEQMGSLTHRTEQGVYSGVGALTYLVSDFASIYTQLEKPRECAASWGGPEDWDYFDERCQNFVYNELIRLKYGKPLYKDIAKINPDTLGMIIEDLEAIEADSPMLGSTAAQVYVAVAPAVQDYLTVWEAMGKKRGTMHKRYKRALAKRGVLRGGNATRDMVDVYYQLHEDMPQIKGLHDTSYVHTIIGFWMRRIDDGTADQLVTFMKKREAEYRGK